MRYYLLVLVFAASVFMPGTCSYAQDKGTLIRDIRMDGFVLGDKDRFVKLFKPFRNKYLTTADMDDILHKIQRMYEEEGYEQLVSITYQVDKHRLVFTALMTS